MRAEGHVASGFPLNQLGWDAFQRLAGTILSEILGQTYEIYSPTGDRGRDGGFQGAWALSGSEDFKGRFTVQSKHVAGERRTIRNSDLADEVPKVRALAAQGLADIYIVITNCRVTVESAHEIEHTFQSVGARYVRVYGAEWIEQKIRESGRLRALVPRVYGLGDLSEIIDERVYAQTKVLLRSMQGDLAKFVPTRAYYGAVDAMDNHGFALLIGEPSAGKTTIAHMLSVVASDRWVCRIMDLDDIRHVRKSWNPESNDQLFIVDDAFGTTQYQRAKSEAWNQTAQIVKAAINDGARFVITSRNYIYERARSDLKEAAFPLLHEGQVVVDVETLSDDERQQILYNHIKLGDQPKDFKTAIKPWLPSVASHKRFQPEIARRLGTRIFTQKLFLNGPSVIRFVAEPRQLLKETIQTLSPRDRIALLFLFIHGGEYRSPIRVRSSDQELERLGVDQASLAESFQSLRGSFVTLIQTDEGRSWVYRHPTISDALSEMIRDDPELQDIYLAAAPLSALLTEVVCGIKDVRGVAIEVPKSLYGDVIVRVKEALRVGVRVSGLAMLRNHGTVYGFLSTRCSEEFLRMFLATEPEFLDQICDVGSYLNSVPEASVVAAFAEKGLLDSGHRAAFIENLKTVAVETPDAGWLTVRYIADMLTEEEKESLLEHVKEVLVADLEDRVFDAVHGVIVSGAREFIQECEVAQEHLTAYRDAFIERGRTDVAASLDTQVRRIDQWIAGASDDETGPPPRPPLLVDSHLSFGSAGTDAFEDVDA